MRAADALIILQARLGSVRLPGKALRRVAGRTVLSRCLERLLASGAAPLVLATTARAEDDVLEEEASAQGVPCLRGADADVLGRFAQVVEVLRPTYVIRATADNPAVDTDAPARVLAHLRTGALDYVVERGLPVGCAVEGMRAHALSVAAERATDAYDREHVTPFLKREEQPFRRFEPWAPVTIRRPDLRLTVDTPEDLNFMNDVLLRAGGASARVPLHGIIRAADRVLGRKDVA
jgi:spore coat polysaccharide biosynthesis protein SpsF (cytidylyltransferase family)